MAVRTAYQIVLEGITTAQEIATRELADLKQAEDGTWKDSHERQDPPRLLRPRKGY